MSERDDVIAGRYRLLDRVGSGGMGAVWRARDELLERDVAVKQLHLEPDGETREKSEVRHQRAMREARIAARLHHQHAVPVFDAVAHQGRPYLVMQYFPSQTLQEIVTDHRTLAPDVVARIGVEVASALAAAHRAGVVHRDVKPGNVLVSADGMSKITDFGIAHAVGDATLTSKGVITGTPAYLAPEVARGERSGEASDVFSLGATLYRALEGHPPVPHQENPLALLHMAASGTIVPPERSGDLTPLLLRMLALDPADRPSMDEVACVLGDRVGATAAGPVALWPAGHGAPPAPASASAPAADGAEDRDAVTTLTLARTAAQAGVAPAGGVPADPPAAAGPSASPLPAPEAPPDDGDGGRRRVLAAVVVLVLAVVLAATVLAVQQQARRGEAGADDDDATALNSEVGPASGPGTTSAATTGTPSTTADPTPATVQPAPSSPGSDPASTTGTESSDAPPSTTPARPDATSAPTASTAAPTTAGANATAPAAQAEDAIRRYYSLLPGDRDAGWALLTERYRRTTARSRSTYEAFWTSIDAVSVSNPQASGSGSVTATLTYEFADGRTFVERTSYELLRQDGVLKIDRSTVLSSSQR
ncbi:MAG: serine/threonine-protein kinase [Acidimicrobiales bacterium]